jgi:hypothetical protein
MQYMPLIDTILVAVDNFEPLCGVKDAHACCRVSEIFRTRKETMALEI